jgi:2-polyprenyl-6-methoxyphenol hydroxylase-like FAD-dependent oxidoreductase
MSAAPAAKNIDPTYDVIVVGARCAGSPTAMLLARKGYRVLLVDRATFPSDTLSTHQVQIPGIARLARWGLLDRVAAAGTPATRHVRFDPGPIVLEGHYPSFEGVDALYSPRRTVLDTMLVEAAHGAGVEIRQGFVVEEIVTEDGRVVGIRGRERGGAVVTETARLVVGADGKHSIVAKTVNPAVSLEKPALSMGYYTYWADVPVTGGEMYGRERRLVGAWPTNDGLLLTYVAAPVEEFHAFRADIEGTADMLNVVRKPFGPGWALAGDAGLVMDPITGQGIGDAFRDAELLTEAIDAGFSERQPLDEALAAYEQRRNEAALPMLEFTTELASFTPPKSEQLTLFRSLAGKQTEIDRFFGVLTGTVPIPAYFAAGNLVKLIGLRGMAKIALSKIRAPRRQTEQPVSVAQV